MTSVINSGFFLRVASVQKFPQGFVFRLHSSDPCLHKRPVDALLSAGIREGMQQRQGLDWTICWNVGLNGSRCKKNPPKKNRLFFTAWARA